jgi:molecular chaperone DnaJ
MMFRDPYAILDVPMGSDDAQIRKAFRAKAAMYHPDRQRGLTGDALKKTQNRFADINWAFKQIKDAAARGAWDAQQAQRFSGDEAVAAVRDMPERGEDVKARIEVSFLEAFHGATRQVTVHAKRRCGECGGSGAAPGHSSHTCPDCRGAGRHRLGELSTPCMRCEGWGAIITEACSAPGCVRGMVEADRELTVQVPPGIRSGQILTLRQEGQPGWRTPGDAQITVEVAAHPFFERREYDLQITVPVSYTEALIGSESVRIPDPTGGALLLTVPPSTQSGTRLRVNGKGFPRYHDPATRGDLYALIHIAVPQHPSDEFLRKAVQMDAFNTEDPRAHLFEPPV